MCNTGDTFYDDELKKRIPFLETHPSYLPYIGTEYRNSKIKILHVGNCHYIEPSQDPDRQYGYKFFRDNWFDETKCSDDFNLPQIYAKDRQMSECPKDLEWEKNDLSCVNAWNEYCFNTRSVIGEVLSGKRHEKNLHGAFILYPIFREAIKALACACAGILPLSDIDRSKITFPKEKKEYPDYFRKIEPYNYIAYTDFHFFPSLVNGEAKVDESLEESAVEEKVLDLIMEWENNPLIQNSSYRKIKLILKHKDDQNENVVNWLEKNTLEEIKEGLLKREGKQKTKSIIKSLHRKETNVDDLIIKEISLTTSDENEEFFRLPEINKEISKHIRGLTGKNRDKAVKEYVFDLIRGWENTLKLPKKPNTELKLSLKNKNGKILNSLIKPCLEEMINGLNNDEGEIVTISLIQSLNKVESGKASNFVDEIGLILVDGDGNEEVLFEYPIKNLVAEAKEKAMQFYKNIVVPKSIETLEEIVKIIEPDLIWITSEPVRTKYKEHMENCEDNDLKDITILYADHPNSLHKNEEKEEFVKELTKYVKEVFKKNESSSQKS